MIPTLSFTAPRGYTAERKSDTLTMKSKIAVVLILAIWCATSLRAADDRTPRMLLKADEILVHASVVSSRAVGYGGACPEANWALSVICASKHAPVEHLLALSERCQPAGFVMCLLGVRVLDEKRFETELADRRPEIAKAKLTVQTAVGCLYEEKPALDVLSDKSWGREWLICDPIPELWETIRVDPFTVPVEEKADQSARPTAHP